MYACVLGVVSVAAASSGLVACNQILGNATAGSVDDADASSDAALTGDQIVGGDGAALPDSDLDARGPDAGCVDPNAPCTGVVVATITDPRTIVADATRVYFTSGTPGAVMTLDPDGQVTTAVGNASNASGVAFDPAVAGDVYYTRSLPPVVARVGGNPLAIDSGNTHTAMAQFVAVDPTYVVFTDPGNRQVLSQVKTGANALATTTLSGNAVPWAIVTAPAGPAASPTAYFTNRGMCHANDGSVQAIGLPAGGNATTVVNNLACPVAIAVDATNVYFVERGKGVSDGTVKAVPRAGGVPYTLALAQSSPAAIVVGGSSVFWANAGAVPGEGTIMQGGLADGGAPRVLASKQAAPVAIALSGKTLYWLNAGVGSGAVGTLMKIDVP